MQQPGVTPKFVKNVSLLRAKAHAGILFAASMVAGANAGYLIAYAANTDPAPGDTLNPNNILDAVPVAANGFAALGANFAGMNAPFGVVLLFSTNVDTYTVPAANAVFMRSLVQ